MSLRASFLFLAEKRANCFACGLKISTDIMKKPLLCCYGGLVIRELPLMINLYSKGPIFDNFCSPMEPPSIYEKVILPFLNIFSNLSSQRFAV